MGLLLRPARVLVLGLLCALPWVARGDAFSPGDLTRGHANLEGLSNCTKCHAGRGGSKLSAEKCLTCHQELAPELAAHRGFHGNLPAEDRASCEKCHHEHQGRDFALIEWLPSKKGFLHASTGFPLQGKHARVDCNACHQPKRIEDPAVRSVVEKQHRKETFLGLGTACTSCHFDEHRGQLGTGCQVCHRETGWKPAPGFSHEKTDFPLLGKHQQVGCAQCHRAQSDPKPGAFPAPVASSYLTYADVPHDGCAACHKDPHESRFGANCTSCHTPKGWKQVKSGSDTTRAFHDRTRFPLTGQHEAVPCASCHGPWPGQKARFKGLAFGSCESCHADAHEGQLGNDGPSRKGGARGPGCDRCHTVQGFLPARFDLADHAKTAYPLEGGHRAVPCSGCHVQDRALLAKVPSAIKAELKKQRRPERFSLTSFTFPAAVVHPPGACQACHGDPHAGQFAARMAQGGCPSCHQVESFHAVRFDHAQTRFPLEGPHAQAACSGCHRPAADGRVQYQGVSTSCASCHADPHLGQFAPAGSPTACERCHQVTSFVPTRFEHRAPFTAFLLTGKHAALSCASCHPKVQVASGVQAARYRGTPQRCADCHQDFHRGAFQGFAP